MTLSNWVRVMNMERFCPFSLVYFSLPKRSSSSGLLRLVLSLDSLESSLRKIGSTESGVGVMCCVFEEDGDDFFTDVLELVGEAIL